MISVAAMEHVAKHQVLSPRYCPIATEIEPYRGIARRFDVIGIYRPKRQAKIIEIKSSRSDFTSDVKWTKYLPWCTHFTFMAPEGVISPEELPPKIGLIEVYQDTRPSKENVYHYRVAKKCYMLRPQVSIMQYVRLMEAINGRLSRQIMDLEGSGE